MPQIQAGSCQLADTYTEAQLCRSGLVLSVCELDIHEWDYVLLGRARVWAVDTGPLDLVNTASRAQNTDDSV